jgi:hypothetical protein
MRELRMTDQKEISGKTIIEGSWSWVGSLK